MISEMQNCLWKVDELVTVCACVVSHGYGGLGCGRDGGSGLYACRTKPKEVGRMSGDGGTLPECEVIH